ncbi:hypothetical protein [Variovorax rhizosphaerae]|uniref:Uncharacterized protein n=1 Tax=Variovorax rhizosphaerae TaxID=1836200 RepID=A0ABU8WUT2_9BURK
MTTTFDPVDPHEDALAKCDELVEFLDDAREEIYRSQIACVTPAVATLSEQDVEFLAAIGATLRRYATIPPDAAAKAAT